MNGVNATILVYDAKTKVYSVNAEAPAPKLAP
jgi:hypothetical protein